MNKSIKQLLAAALICSALHGTRSFAEVYLLSSFDSDLSSSPGGNMWGSIDTPNPTAITWDSSGISGGAMRVSLDWMRANQPWEWQDAKVQLDPSGSGALPSGPVFNLANYQTIEFDAKVVSAWHTDIMGQYGIAEYGGVQVVAQSWGGWGGNPANIDTGYHCLGEVFFTTTDNWIHVSVPTSSWTWTLGRLTLNFFMQNSLDSANHTEVLIDNVQLVPEPASWTLLLCGMAALAISRRRRFQGCWRNSGGNRRVRSVTNRHERGQILTFKTIDSKA